MVRHVALAVVLSASLAWAKSPVSKALSDVKEASELIEDKDGSCGRKVGSRLDEARDALKDLRDEGGRKAMKSARRALEKVIDSADEHCREKTAGRVAKLMNKAIGRLDDLRDERWEERRDRDDDDDEPSRETSAEPVRPTAAPANGVTFQAGGFRVNLK